MSYNNIVLEHYENPRNVGSLNRDDNDVGTGIVGAPSCGDVMKLQIKVDEETEEIIDAKFKTFGCGAAIASSSFVTEKIIGLTISEASEVKNTVIVKELSLPPVKVHCSLLAEDAVKAAIADYKEKKKKKKKKDTMDSIEENMKQYIADNYNQDQESEALLEEEKESVKSEETTE